MEHYLVTDGCGSIGSHLAEGLRDLGHKIRIVDNLSNGKRDNVACFDDVIIQV